MARILIHNTATARQFTADGAYRLLFLGDEGRRSFAVVWDSELPRAGSIELSFDGNEGVIPATLDLSAGVNAYKASQPLPFLDVDVSGLPEGGAFTLYCYPQG